MTYKLKVDWNMNKPSKQGVIRPPIPLEKNKRKCRKTVTLPSLLCEKMDNLILFKRSKSHHLSVPSLIIYAGSVYRSLVKYRPCLLDNLVNATFSCRSPFIFVSQMAAGCSLRRCPRINFLQYQLSIIRKVSSGMKTNRVSPADEVCKYRNGRLGR